MNLTRRNLITLAGSAVAAGALSACGSNKGGIGEGSSPSASGSAAGNAVSLTQWYHEYGEAGTQDAVKKYAAGYDKASVQVKWNAGDYAKLLSAALLTKDIPDVFESEMGPSIDMIKAGQVADLTDAIGEAKSRFNPELIERMSYEGKIYGIPQVVDMHLLYYRRSLLEKAGLQPPKTFTELVAAANKLKTKDMGGLFVGNDGIGPIPTALLYASGNDWFDEGRTKAGFLDASFYKALTDFRDLFNSGALLQSASKDWFDGSPFANEETAMQWGGLWSMTDIQKTLGDDFGVLPFPAVGDKGKQATMFGAFGACVAAKGANVEAAKEYVKWLWVDQTDHQVDFANNYGTHVPAQGELAPKCTKLAEGAGADAAKILADFGKPASDILWSGAMGDAFNAAVSNIIKKKADPAKELAAVGSRVTAELKRVKG
ncbi:ABC transporter substrate-binding protein [Luteococcus japonicus]|uniref:ABC transporter sugar-binding protein n=1 Tax=Luteococcus japonicus LSP_Lj1 TaxID=1255658 RepID=A0A1R4JIB0_9ACTN|nr:sugar ABC transporter substrate-binding protein [Luteococcus japonicus]SJN31766.1 ABC transporter sugar-binding protein [Luteococcus japonicus LSP_Lj1]